MTIKVDDHVVPKALGKQTPARFLEYAGVVVEVSDDGERCKIFSKETGFMVHDVQTRYLMVKPS